MSRLFKEYLAYPRLGAELIKLNKNVVYTEIPYGEDKRQTVLVFYPRPGAPKRDEAVAYFHGGGWRFFSPKDFAFAGEWFASRGYAAVLPGYRTVPRVRYPAPLEDGFAGYAAGLDFLRSAGYDAGRAIVTGASAGGHTAAMLALSPGRWHGAKVVGLCSMSGVVNFDACPEKFMAMLLHDLFPKKYDRSFANPINKITGNERFSVLCTHGAEDAVVNPNASATFCEAFNAKNGSGAELFLQTEGAVCHSDLLIRMFSMRLAATERLERWLEEVSSAPEKA